jgi:hypothetical protein
MVDDKNNFINVYVDDNNIFIKKKFLLINEKNEIKISDNIDIIKIKKGLIKKSDNDVVFNIEDFLIIISGKNKTFEFESYITEKLIYSILPVDTECIKLDLYVNGEKLLPVLNNLPFNLKKIIINRIDFILMYPRSRKLLIYDNKKSTNFNEKLINYNIKLPFNCKIIFPNGKVYNNLDNLYLKIKFDCCDMNIK